MQNLKKRNKNIRRSLVLALGFVCSISLSGCSTEKIDVSEHYGNYVSSQERVDLFVKSEDSYTSVATAEANIVFTLAGEDQQNMEIPYFKLADQDIYIDANKVSSTDNAPKDADYIPYVPFNENLITNENFTLYDENGNTMYQIQQARSFPILIKEENRYGVDISGHIFYISVEDKKELVENQNTTAETATQVPVLMYHAFYEEANKPDDLNGNYVEKEMFRQHLEYLKTNQFVTLRMQDVERYLDGKVRLPRQSIAITMDDGYSNEATIAGPLLQEYGFFGTAFLITNWYDQGILPQEWLDAKNMGLELQSHSNGLHDGGCNEQHGGKILCTDYDGAVQDVKLSMDITGGNVFCYPFGDFNERAKKILTDAGIHMAFTTQYGTIEPGMDKLELPRIRVHGEASIERFAASITY